MRRTEIDESTAVRGGPGALVDATGSRTRSSRHGGWTVSGTLGGSRDPRAPSGYAADEREPLIAGSRALAASLSLAWVMGGAGSVARATGKPAPAPAPATVKPPGGDDRDCAGTIIGSFKREGRPEVIVRYVPAPSQDALVFEAGLAVDADGGRHAYRDDDKGLDTIKNACPADRSRSCYGIVERAPGDRVRQAPPNEAYFVSQTSLGDPSKPRTDPDRYVDSEAVAYLALPLRSLVAMAAAHGVPHLPLRLGDLAFVRSRKTGQAAYAIFADVGPAGRIGEGSIALAEALQLPSNPRHGGVTSGVQVVVLLGSGNRRPRPQVDIDRDARAAFERWGGERRFDACLRAWAP